jgi:hypothetical protein
MTRRALPSGNGCRLGRNAGGFVNDLCTAKAAIVEDATRATELAGELPSPQILSLSREAHDRHDTNCEHPTHVNHSMKSNKKPVRPHSLKVTPEILDRGDRTGLYG